MALSKINTKSKVVTNWSTTFRAYSVLEGTGTQQVSNYEHGAASRETDKLILAQSTRPALLPKNVI